ncbi:MAG: response regulator transcription factor [Chloroflexi bacterium]|nr:response regulator transcription factor [Chloroflexota bacterium]
MIVDDHKMVRKGLRTFLTAFSDLEMVGEADSGEEAVRLCIQLQPEVILMDLVMPGMDGASATEAIRARCPQVKIIALTSFPEEDLVERALKAGAISYLLKNVEAEELANAIRAAHAGRSTLAPEAAQALIHVATRPPEIGHDLTAREREVLALMIEGLNNGEIAARLTLSDSTIKFHVSNILSKLSAESRTEAVAIALQHNVVRK